MLLELLLALAVFIGASIALSRVLALTLGSVQISGDEARAADIARSAMSMIESGMYKPEALQGAAIPDLLGTDGAMDTTSVEVDQAEWMIEVGAEPSPYAQMTLVSVTASRPSSAGRTASYTLRQLVNLGDAGGRP
jgi:hypothetical protein